MKEIKPMCQICRTATYVEKSKYPESSTHYCCGAGCNSFFTPAKDNAKLADATLDSFRGSEAVPVCPEHGTREDVELCNVPSLGKYICQKRGCEALGFDVPVKSKPVPSNQMYQSLKATFEKCLGICERKSHDYARGENPYRNFETVTRLGVSVQQGLLIRTLDKITRLENLLTVAPYVTEETFEDTIDDAINYLAILKARREFERTN